jgi:hypothetical protein
MGAPRFEARSIGEQFRLNDWQNAAKAFQQSAILLNVASDGGGLGTAGLTDQICPMEKGGKEIVEIFYMEWNAGIPIQSSHQEP